MMKQAQLKKVYSMLHRIFMCCFLAIAFQTAVFAQEPEKKKEGAPADTTKLFEKKPDVTAPETPKEKKLEKKLSKRVYSVSQFTHETSLFVKQPVKWVSRDWVRLGIMTALTFGVMPFDEDITNSTQGEQRYYHSAFIEGGRIYGEWYSIGAVAGGFGLYGLLAHDTADRKS